MIIKTRPVQNCAKIVLQIPLPTSVDCPFVILAKLVNKVILEVRNASVATLVNRVLVMEVSVKHVRRVNLVRPMMQHLILAGRVTQAIIKKTWAKHRVCHAYPGHLRPLRAQLPAMNVGLVNTNRSPMLQNAFHVPMVVLLRKGVHRALIVWPGNLKKQQTRAKKFVPFVHRAITRTRQTWTRASNAHLGMPNRRPGKRRALNAVRVNSMPMLVWLHVNVARWDLQEKEVTLMRRNAENVTWGKQRRLKVRRRAVGVI